MYRSICLKRIDGLPLNMFNYLVEGHLSKEISPPRNQVLGRYALFYQRMAWGLSREVAMMAELAPPHQTSGWGELPPWAWRTGEGRHRLPCWPTKHILSRVRQAFIKLVIHVMGCFWSVFESMRTLRVYIYDIYVSISVFQGDHLEKKSIRQTPFLGVLGLYNHPLKDRLPQTSVEGCPQDLFIWPALLRNLKKIQVSRNLWHWVLVWFI